MGGKHSKGKGALDIASIPCFEDGLSDMTLAQIYQESKAANTTAPTELPIQKIHTINSDSGGHRGKIYCLGWAKNDSTVFCSGSEDGKLLFFSAITGARIQDVPLETSWIKSVDMSLDGEMALSGTPNGPMIVRTGIDWNDKENKKTGGKKNRASVYSGHEGGVNDVKFTSDSNFVSASGDYNCAFWDVNSTASFVHDYRGHEGDVQAIAVHENTFVSGSCDCSAKLWDIRSQDVIRTYADHDADVGSVSISWDGNFLVTGSDDSFCNVYDLRQGTTPLHKLYEEKAAFGIQSVAFSPHGYHVVAGDEKQHVKIWNLANNTVQLLDAGHQKKIGQVAFSHDGRFLGVASHDQTSTVYASDIPQSI